MSQYELTIKLGSLFPKTAVPKATSAAGSILLETARKSLNPWLQAPVCTAAAQPALRELWGLFHIRESCEGMWQGGDRGMFVFAFGEKHKGSQVAPGFRCAQGRMELGWAAGKAPGTVCALVGVGSWRLETVLVFALGQQEQQWPPVARALAGMLGLG